MKTTNLDKGRYKKVVLALFLFLFVGMTIQAQTRANEIRMKTGNEIITDEVKYNFYDSGGPYVMDPEQDPNNDYNWVSWYQHNESYLLHFIKPSGYESKGIKVVFNYLLINNDHLKFYEGDIESEEHLIVDLTNNDFSTNYDTINQKFTVISHGNMTIRFESDYHWRDAGWEAEVMLWDYSPQPPVALMEACDNNIVLLPGSKAATGETKMYYTLDGNDPVVADPLTGTSLYEGPFAIEHATTVKAVLVENGTSSAVSTYQFTKLIEPPAAPTVVRIPNTNKVIITAPVVPPDQNDTYYVRYSLDTDPQYSDLEQAKADTIEVDHPCRVRAMTRGTTCPDTFSSETYLDIDEIYVPMPEITITGTGATGSATITCSLNGAVIYYTIDGTDPTTATTTSGSSSVTLSVPAGTTVKAMAAHSGDDYVPSAIASAIYIPGGDGGQGVYGSVVLLDDREDHRWSYYSDGDQPVHSLKPADVKITYFGYGDNTMTTTDTNDNPTTFNGDVAAADVAVGPNEAGNQFVYLKTLEAANEDGSGNYPYTLIPNPFSKRPAFEGATPTTREVYLTTTGNRAGRGTLTVNYTNANGQNATETVNINSNNFNNTRSITTRVGTSITYTLTRTAGTVNSYGNYDASEANGGTRIWYATTNNNTQSNSYTIEAPAAEKDYRGFYAWRVKRLSGVTIQGYNVGDIIPAETEIKFVASANSTNNEAEFEALWAQAYVVTTNTATGLHAGVSYERNFVVGAAPNAALTVPVTYSRYNPDGTGGANTVNIGTFTCAADTKFEYMNLNNGTLTANNHDLIMGRGLTGTAAMIQGINGNANDGLDYMLRVESGTYTELSFVRSSGATVSGRYLVKSILGCDYDRATNNNGNLTVSNNTQLFFSQSVTFGGSENKDQKTFDLVVKGGQYQRNIWNGNNGANNNGAYNHAFYCGQNQAGNTYPGVRYVTVEGGEFASLNGGRGVGGTSTTYASPGVVTFDLRIKGGLFHGSVFGSAADNPSIGSRRMVITGGEILGWVAAGANGTGSVGSSHAGTDGNSYVYVGGNSVVGSTNPPTINETPGGNVFGAGRGRSNQKGSMINSNVVVADNTTIYQNVYGAGFCGYIEDTSNVYVLGGNVKQNVFGGGYNHSGNYDNTPKTIPTSNVYVKGGTVTGSIYGGSNSSGTVTDSHVIMSNGNATNVFGGGLGPSTIIGNIANVAFSGGAINNIYGGGEEGTVADSTVVIVSGGTMENVFGAGMGSSNSTANIGNATTVTISGGTIAQSVYGGGEKGNVKQATNPGKGEEAFMADPAPVSTVNITGGNIGFNVFGGGSMGFTNGGTLVNMSGGSVEGSVFGGAFGTNGKVYVAGLRVVNMRGGTVNKHVYGGSRNADDALTFNPGTFANSTETATASVVNYAGGYVHYQVFASGYFGNVFGSTYAFVGTNAILNAPHHVYENTDANRSFFNAHQALRIGGSVWAGGDFGNYDGSKFGDPTISGRSDVFIDGTGYDTESNNTTNTNYMYIGGSLYGSGTSCDAGKQGRHIIIQNYGQVIGASQPTAALPYSSATRALYSVQRADSLDIVNSHIVFLGEGKINSLVATEKYTLYEFNKVRINNGSSLFMNYPADQMKKFGSYKVDDVYSDEPSYTKVSYETSSLEETPNKIRVSNGAYIQVKYVDANNVAKYGELEGFAYMMSDDANNTCAYARPKQSTDAGNIIPTQYDNPDDGGWVSYDGSLNTYSIAGGTVTSGGVQMPYENHTVSRNGEDYFRIWRAGGIVSYREGVFVVQSKPKVIVQGQPATTDYYGTVDVVVSLPAFENCSEGTAYYRIASFDGNTTIDYGTDVMMVNAACYGNTGASEWMYINGTNASASFVTGVDSTNNTLKANGLKYIKENPNVNFGLVAIPSGGLQGGTNMIICEASDPKIASMQWANTHNELMPEVTFRLTYHNNLTNNVVWDPIHITFEQVDCSGNVTATIDVALTVTTLTNIDQDFVTQAYAVARGNGSVTGSYTAKIVLPQYVMHVNTVGEISKWTCEGVTFVPEEGFANDLFVGGQAYLNGGNLQQCNNKFGMTMVAGLNFDNTTGWESYAMNAQDMYGWNKPNYVFGETTARDPIGFDFTLLYDGRQKTNGNYMVGKLNFRMKFTNYEGAGAEPYTAYLNIIIEVWFLGQGSNYYIDGVNGNNLYSGRYPNAAKKTLSGIFNRTDYVAGDYIFVVNTVTADGNTTLSWNGKAYDQVTLFRYPGGHECVPNAPGAESHYESYDLDNNPAFTGSLVDVETNMEMTGIVLDGFYAESQKPEGQAAGDLTGYYHTYQNAEAPLIQVKDGGRLSVYGASRIENNFNESTDGGGIYVADQGVLNLYDGSAVDANYVATDKNGGGIYVNEHSVVQLSDVVNITGNQQRSTSKADAGIDNNVYLSTYNSHVNVGSAETDDPYTMLLSTAKVGITKNPNWGSYYYAPVAFSDGGQAYLGNLITENAPETGAIMWDDQTKYEILSLNNTHLSEPTNYVYFVGTWVTEVTKNPQHPDEPNNFDLTQIDTPYELAWLISYVNGLNGATAHPNATATLTGDIDMSANIWVPITNFRGTLEGNGHVVTGLRSPLNSENMGMFGVTNGATISNLVAQSTFAGGTVKNLGTLIGTMNGGTLSNVEAAGRLTGTNATANIGGLVGEVTSGTIHSAFAVDTIVGGTNTVAGGLVGTLAGNLYNSYANTIMSGATKMGGLVGVNNGHVENCYAVVGEQTFPAFANTNNGTITICYADTDNGYVTTSGTNASLSGHGTYDPVKDSKAYGYMYDDNKVNATNDYVVSAVSYANSQIDKWPGLLSSLNQWVAGHSGYTTWNRPVSADINGDLPVLAFPMDNCLGTTDGKFLRYSAADKIENGVQANNGLDNLLGTVYNGKSANIYLYNSAIDVVNGTGNNKLFIHEDAALIQNSSETINATVGVTFDNSHGTAGNTDFYGGKLLYDWHLMATPLSNAPMGISWSSGQVNWWDTQDWDDNIGQVTGVENSYLPDGMDAVSHWDFYTYYEPQYHWINFKRNSDSHFHFDENHWQINYTNEENLIPGRGYLAAIDTASYLNNTGTLNNGDVTIELTAEAPNDDAPDGFFTYDKGSNLIGNPYQAYLNLSTLSQKTGYTTFYIYDAAQNSYVPFVAGSSKNPVTAKTIHPHQGFFVVTDTDTNPEDFKFTYDMATTEKDANSYFRGNSIDYPVVNVFVDDAKGHRDLTIIELNRPELGGALKTNALRSANFKIGAHLDGKNYGLVFAPEGTQRVPVHFRTYEEGTYTLTWSTHNGDFTSLILVDNLTGTRCDMLQNDHYTFNGSVDDYAARFYITFNVTDVNELNGNEEAFAWFDGNDWIVTGKGQLQVVDVTGRVLQSVNVNGDQTRLHLDGVAAGVYVMRLTDGIKSVSQKIVVK